MFFNHTGGPKPPPVAPGADKRKAMEALLESQENLELMERRYNSSKGARTVDKWKDTPLGRDASDGYLQHLRDKQIAIAKAMADIVGKENLPKDFQDLLDGVN